MKISLNTIKQFLDFDLPPVEEVVERINQQLGGVEEIIDLRPKYKDVVIVKIVECEKHPNADKLSVCMIDDGGAVKDVERDDRGLVRVVCGAPNAHADMFAAWLPPKSTVPATFNDATPFALDVRELRGVQSNGMLAAADELALGSDHAGIIEIDPNEWKPSDVEIKPGASFARAFGLDDVIIDIENKMFTHRPDCFGQLGVAREIAGILGHEFVSPDWYTKMQQNSPVKDSILNTEMQVFNEAGEKVPRFTAVVMKDVTVKQSPLWLQVELVRLGSKAINNIVDVTNYVMLLTAQPTHAYDYDKLRGHKLGARMAKAGEKTTLLNDKTYELTEDDIVIVDGEGIVGLGGVMGGGNSEVSPETKTIVLECANFDMYTVRKTSMRHGLFTDAVTRFSKGQSSLQQPYVMSLMMRSIIDVAGGEQASEVFDNENKKTILEKIMVTPSFIIDRLGVHIKNDEIKRLLGNVEFSVEEHELFSTKGYESHLADMNEVSESQSSEIAMYFTPPFWRTDIELPEDFVEEVGRLYGFDKLPHELPRRSVVPAAVNPAFALKKTIRAVLSRSGANEVLTYSFVHENTLKKAGQDKSLAFQLSNAISPDLQYYRLSLTPSLLDKIHPNVKAGHDEFALFEIGKGHIKGFENEEDLPLEFNRLACVYTSKKARDGAVYYHAKRLLGNMLLKRGVAKCTFEPFVADGTDPSNVYYEPKRVAKIMVGDVYLGHIGEYKASVVQAFKLPEYTAGFEISLDALLTLTNPRGYQPLSRYPKVTQDISLKVPVEVNYADVYQTVWQTVEAEQPGKCDTKLEPLSIYQAEGDTTHKTITLRVSIASYEKTLTDKDVNGLMEKVASSAATSFGATRI